MSSKKRKQPKIGGDNKKKDFTLSYHLVLLLDILGQKSELRKLRALPGNEAEKKEVFQTLKRTAGTVILVREQFEEFFEGAFNYTPQIPNFVPRESYKAYRKMVRHEIKYSYFSDSIIATVDLQNDCEFCVPVNGIFGVLYAACFTMLYGLATGHAIRGGIDIGLGINLNSKEVYGSALERAYLLENKFAEYPRILIGNELYKFLRQVVQQNPQTHFGGMAKGIARECLKFFTIDQDKQVIVDFLGNAIPTDDDLSNKVVKSAYDFVIAQHENYCREENIKLACRYGKLRTYFEHRVGRWGIHKQCPET